MCYPWTICTVERCVIEFDSYEDFKENYKVNVPEDFNFGFDVVDAWAKEGARKKSPGLVRRAGGRAHLHLHRYHAALQ